MDTLNDLLDQIKRTRTVSSDAALGRLIGVSRQTVSNWRTGNNLPDTVACARIAELAGEPLARVLGLVGEARATEKAEKAVWRRLATAAALMLTLGAAAYLDTATAGLDGLRIMYIM